MPLYARDGGVWKSGGMPVRDGGVWKNPTQVYARDGGVWKPVLATGPRLNAFGSNDAFRTGLGTDTGSTTTPTQVGSFTDWEWCSAGSNHSLAIRAGRL